MTLAENVRAPMQRARKFPVLATERLVLRAPRAAPTSAGSQLSPTIAALQTIPRASRIPTASPTPNISLRRSTSARAKPFHHLPDGVAVGACGLDPRGDVTLPSSAIGSARAIGAAASPPRRCARSSIMLSAILQHEALQAGARVSNPASRRVLEKCALPVDRRALDPHPRHQFGRADRPLPARSRAVAVAQVLGPRPPRRVNLFIVRQLCAGMRRTAPVSRPAPARNGLAGSRAWHGPSVPSRWISIRAFSNACCRSRPGRTLCRKNASPK